MMVIDPYKFAPAVPVLDPAYLWAAIAQVGNEPSNTIAQTVIFDSLTSGTGSSRYRRSGTPINGKKYCEFSIVPGTPGLAWRYVGFGVTSRLDPSVFYNPGMWDIFTSNGQGCGLPAAGHSNNGAMTNSNAFGFNAGDVIGIAVDMDAKLMWYAVNNVWITGNPVTGLGAPGVLFPGETYYFHVSDYACSTHHVNLNLKIQPLTPTYTPPAGFTMYQS